MSGVLTIAGEAADLAGELAALRGVTAEEAVADALRQVLERERLRQENVQHIVALGREIRAHLTEPEGGDDEWMYDKDGLPA